MCKLNLKQNCLLDCKLSQQVEDPLAVFCGFDSRNIDGDQVVVCVMDLRFKLGIFLNGIINFGLLVC